jgi:hypothetical protein
LKRIEKKKNIYEEELKNNKINENLFKINNNEIDENNNIDKKNNLTENELKNILTIGKNIK